MKNLFIAAVAFATLTGTAYAAPATKAAEEKMPLCPIMKGQTAKKKYPVAHKGKTYHVCCSTCVKMFNKNPEKYIKAMEKTGQPAAKKAS